MIATAVLAGVGLALTLAVGVVVHELLHAIVLRTGGVDCSLAFHPTEAEGSGFRTLVSGSLASVEMDSVPATCSLWRLRAAAMAPLAMLLPVGGYAWFVTGGQASGSLLESMVVIGWMACALPSPADFSIVWHAAETKSLVGENA